MLKNFLGKRVFSLGIATVIAVSGFGMFANSNVYGASQLKIIGNAKAKLMKNQTVIIDGQTYNINAYNIDGYNYFKARDITKPLNFYTTWDKNLDAVWIDTDDTYNDDSSKNATLKDNVDVVVKSDYMFVNSTPTVVTFCNIDGYNYFKLRDMADATKNGLELKPNEKYITVDFDKGKNAIIVKTLKGDGTTSTTTPQPTATTVPTSTLSPVQTATPSQIEEGTFPAKILKDGVTPEMWYASMGTYEGQKEAMTDTYFVSGSAGECTWYAKGRFAEVYNRKTPLTEFYGETKDWVKNITVLVENGNKDNLKFIEDVNDIREKSMAVFAPANGATITEGHVVFVERVERDSNGKPLYVYYTESNASPSNNSIYDPLIDGIVKKESFDYFINPYQLTCTGYIISN